MIHLTIHLVNEIKLGGSTHLRWMYSSERNMCKFKGLVRNRSNAEGCIAEGIVADDCLTFCLRYLHVGVKTRFSRYQMEDDEDIQTKGDDFSHMFPKIGHPIENEKKSRGKIFEMDIHQWCEAHRYALFNTGDDKVEAFIK